MFVASVERRTSDQKSFVPIFEGEAVTPDEPLRFAVRNAAWGSVEFRLHYGAPGQTVKQIGTWSANVPAVGGYGFVDIDPLRNEGVYVLGAEIRPLYLGSPDNDTIYFKVAQEAYEPTTAPPTAPGQVTLPGIITKLPERLESTVKAAGISVGVALAAILGIVILSKFGGK